MARRHLAVMVQVLVLPVLLSAGAACGGGSSTAGSGGSGSGTGGGGGSGSGTGGGGGSAATGTGGGGGSAATGTGGMGGTGGASAGTGGTGTGGAANAGLPTVGGCPVFTADDAWNTDVSTAAVSATWTSRLQALVGGAKVHPDFGSYFGIPFNVVPASQAPVTIVFDDYPDESDPGPYPIPDVTVARVEGTTDPHSCDGDCHLLVVQQGTCRLYEGYACRYASGGWHCGNGAVWDLTKNSLGQRPDGWTSADAAGLPILAGLVRADEAMAGEINHAFRFTVTCTQASMVAPATHNAVPGGCAGNTNAPPMGLRVRLRADYDVSGFSSVPRAIARAMQRYGLILADNGSNFYITGEDNPAWDDDALNELKQIPASAFEALEP